MGRRRCPLQRPTPRGAGRARGRAAAAGGAAGARARGAVSVAAGRPRPRAASRASPSRRAPRRARPRRAAGRPRDLAVAARSRSWSAARREPSTHGVLAGRVDELGGAAASPGADAFRVGPSSRGVPARARARPRAAVPRACAGRLKAEALLDRERLRARGARRLAADPRVGEQLGRAGRASGSAARQRRSSASARRHTGRAQPRLGGSASADQSSPGIARPSSRAASPAAPRERGCAPDLAGGRERAGLSSSRRPRERLRRPSSTCALLASLRGSNGWTPKRSRCIKTPSENTSALCEAPAPASTSGAEYATVGPEPSISRAIAASSAALPTQRAEPKSTMRTSQSSAAGDASSTFSGLRSKCTTPLAWMYATASTISRSMRAAAASEYGPRATSRSKSSPPVAISITRNAPGSRASAAAASAPPPGRPRRPRRRRRRRRPRCCGARPRRAGSRSRTARAARPRPRTRRPTPGSASPRRSRRSRGARPGTPCRTSRRRAGAPARRARATPWKLRVRSTHRAVAPRTRAARPRRVRVVPPPRAERAQRAAGAARRESAQHLIRYRPLAWFVLTGPHETEGGPDRFSKPGPCTGKSDSRSHKPHTTHTQTAAAHTRSLPCLSEQ